jgi:hypothetical protein
MNQKHKRTSEAQPLVHGKQSLNMLTIMQQVAQTALLPPP